MKNTGDEEYGSDISMNTKDEDLVWYVSGDDDESDSESEYPSGYRTCEEMELGGALMIYPSLDLDHYTYRHAHVHDFSKRAIANYNQDTGHSYEFVELVEAFADRDSTTDLVTTIFKARDDLSITSFKAQTYPPGRSLSHPNLDIKVVPLHSYSTSDISSTYGSELEFQDSACKQAERVELLQISS